MTRKALVDRAVLVLQEALTETRKAPVEPRPGLRLALAYLYAVSDGKEEYGMHPRSAFDEFMLAVKDDRSTDFPHEDALRRSAAATAAYNGILRRLGSRS